MDLIQKLEKEFWKSIEKNTKSLKKAGVLFSAGVDSAIIAKAVSFEVPKTVLFSAGFENSPDLKVVEESSEKMGLTLVVKEVSDEEVKKALAIVEKLLTPKNLSQSLNLQIGVSEFFAMQAAKEAGFETIFMGQGADELFAGYDSFRKIVEENGLKAVNAECKRLFQKAERVDLKRDNAIAEHFGLELRLPFCEKEFAEFCLKIPAIEKIHSENDFLRKHVLRKLAERIKVPEISCKRPKKAMQYGSNIRKKVLKLLN